MSAPWLSDQTRLLALVTGEPYAVWARRFCDERRIPWRDEYGTPMDERNQTRKASHNG